MAKVLLTGGFQNIPKMAHMAYLRKLCLPSLDEIALGYLLIAAIAFSYPKQRHWSFEFLYASANFDNSFVMHSFDFDADWFLRGSLEE